MSQDACAAALKTVVFELEDEPVALVSFAELDAARLEIYRRSLPEFAEGLGADVVLACRCAYEGDVDPDEWEGPTTCEHVVSISNETGEATLLAVEDVMMMEPLPIPCAVEYQFDAGGAWTLAKVSEGSLEMWRTRKFALWLKQMRNPDCEAAFKRMLQVGLITTLYDHAIFPTDEAHRAQYEVTNERGKKVPIPHPVCALRVWDCEAGAYRAIDPTVEGAPRDAAGAKKFWAELLAELTAKHGAEYMASLMA
jgi:hypothetical protein